MSSSSFKYRRSRGGVGGKYCCMPGCRSSSAIGCQVFRIPTTQGKRHGMKTMQWAAEFHKIVFRFRNDAKFEKRVHSGKAFICSKHFDPSDIVQSNHKSNLRYGSLPIIHGPAKPRQLTGGPDVDLETTMQQCKFSSDVQSVDNVSAVAPMIELADENLVCEIEENLYHRNLDDLRQSVNQCLPEGWQLQDAKDHILLYSKTTLPMLPRLMVKMNESLQIFAAFHGWFATSTRVLNDIDVRRTLLPDMLQTVANLPICGGISMQNYEFNEDTMIKHYRTFYSFIPDENAIPGPPLTQLVAVRSKKCDIFLLRSGKKCQSCAGFEQRQLEQSIKPVYFQRAVKESLQMETGVPQKHQQKRSTKNRKKHVLSSVRGNSSTTNEVSVCTREIQKNDMTPSQLSPTSKSADKDANLASKSKKIDSGGLAVSTQTGRKHKSHSKYSKRAVSCHSKDQCKAKKRQGKRHRDARIIALLESLQNRIEMPHASQNNDTSKEELIPNSSATKMSVKSSTECFKLVSRYAQDTNEKISGASAAARIHVSDIQSNENVINSAPISNNKGVDAHLGLSQGGAVSTPKQLKRNWSEDANRVTIFPKVIIKPKIRQNALTVTKSAVSKIKNPEVPQTNDASKGSDCTPISFTTKVATKSSLHQDPKARHLPKSRQELSRVAANNEVSPPADILEIWIKNDATPLQIKPSSTNSGLLLIDQKVYSS